jgi:hypothetical protein
MPYRLLTSSILGRIGIILLNAGYSKVERGIRVVSLGTELRQFLKVETSAIEHLNVNKVNWYCENG